MDPNLSRGEHGSQDATTVDLSGRCVGNSYILVCPIGQGATGTVWRGVERVSGEQVAVKLLHESLLRQPKLVSRFVQERTILKMLRHENVVRVRDLLSVGDSLGLVMDLVNGGSLREHLRKSRTLPAGEAARLLAQVARALAQAHELGVVHRDVKPDNILLQRDGGRLDTRLTDFGIARVLNTSGITTPNAVVGTPLYMAPEAITGAEPSPAADVYALGVVLYELVVGQPPYVGEPFEMLLSRHREGGPKRPAGMPPAAWSVVRSCVDPDPELRPSAAELTESLRNLVRAVADVPALPAPAADHVPPERDSAADRRCAPQSAVGVPEQVSPPGRKCSAPRRGNRPHTGRWARPAAMAALIGGAVLVSGVGGLGARHLLHAGGSKPPAAAVAATSSHAPGAAGVAAPGPSAGPPPAASSRPPAAGWPPAAIAVGNGASGVRAGADVSAGPAGVGVSTGPGKVDAGARAFGPWQCGDAYTWDVGHPVLAKPCHSIGRAVQVVGHMEALPGVQADISLTLQDVETGQVPAGARTCKGLTFNDVTPEQVCGPFELDVPHGRRYVVVESWRYTGRGRLPEGTTRGPEFTW